MKHLAVFLKKSQALVLDLQRWLDRQDVNMQMLIAKLPNPDAGLSGMIETGEYRQGMPAGRTTSLPGHSGGPPSAASH